MTTQSPGRYAARAAVKRALKEERSTRRPQSKEAAYAGIKSRGEFQVSIPRQSRGL